MRNLINPIFLNSPQIVAERLGQKLGLELVLKLEMLNPIRCFKGRGTEYFFATLPQNVGEVVCASVGNFGQGMAYSARARNRALTVFASVNANPLKIDSMRAFGANVVQKGNDFDEAKAAAAAYAKEKGLLFIEDGKEPAITEGAGTIAMELLDDKPLDAVIVPVGNGALINGIGAYIKLKSPSTKVIGVVASGAPAMYNSWKANRLMSTATSATIADGIAVRVPVQEALDEMEQVVDEMWMVADEQIIEAMKIALFDLGLALEPAGAVGLAAVIEHAQDFQNKRVATLLTGGNISRQQMQTWLF